MKGCSYAILTPAETGDLINRNRTVKQFLKLYFVRLMAKVWNAAIDAFD